MKTKYKNSINFSCDFSASPNIMCWPAKLNQVFMNLLINGCQSIISKQQKQTINSPGDFFISSFMDNKNLHISFRDTGLGIPDDIKNKIFDPFFTTKTVGEGTGLGLSLSHEIIERHGGNSSVDTIIDDGTTMMISLPLCSNEDSYESL